MRAMSNAEVAKTFAEDMNRIGDEIADLRNLTDWLTENPNADPRLFAERAAIAFAADALPAGSLRDAWITLRLTSPSHIWGANANQVDRENLLARVQGW